MSVASRVDATTRSAAIGSNSVTREWRAICKTLNSVDGKNIVMWQGSVLKTTKEALMHVKHSKKRYTMARTKQR